MEKTTELYKAVSALNTSTLVPLVQAGTEWGDNQIDQACYNALMFVRRRQEEMSKVIEEINRLQRGE